MKRLYVLALALVFVAPLYAANTCAKTDLECLVTGPTANPTTQWRVDSGGNITTNGSATLGGVFVPFPQTIAQMNALVPGVAGTQIILCSNCTQSALCVSSGTAAGSWVVIAATGPFVGATFSGLAHCQ